MFGNGERQVEWVRLAWTYLGVTGVLVAALAGAAAYDAARRLLGG